jgi:uroporphyrinogen-III synthase
VKALVTRPAEDAVSLAGALAARGIEPLLEPLLAIQFAEDGAARLAPLLPGAQALVFTSANGVRAFVAASRSLPPTPHRDAREGGHAVANLDPRFREDDELTDARTPNEASRPGTADDHRSLAVFAVGDATARAAVEAGFTNVASAGGNVEDLARLAVARLSPSDGPVLHVAASAVAGDLAGRLAAAGFAVRRAVLYDAVTATELSDATRQALAAGAIDLALFFSPRTAATFVTLAGAARATDTCRGVTAFALSEAVATALRGLAWREVVVTRRPDEPALLAALDDSLAQRAATAQRRGDQRKAAG